MENFEWFTMMFLALSLVFLTSLWLKYGKQMAANDAENFGGCPVHKNKPSQAAKHDIHTFSKVVEARPDDEVVIDQAFNISLKMVESANQKLSNAVKLALYGLYKQSTVGDVAREEPSKLSIEEHLKWSSWNEQKGKTQMAAKREYFQLVYKEIVVALHLNVLLFEDADQIPEELKQHTVSSRPSTSSVANVQSKFEAEHFDQRVHGDPDELFNKFDLTQNNVDVDAIKSYIESNAPDLNKRNENGTTFLCFAVDNLRVDLVRILVEEFSVDVNIRDDMGYTALHSAAMAGDSDLVSFLIEHGADKLAKSTDGEIPCDLAESEEIRLLLRPSDS